MKETDQNYALVVFQFNQFFRLIHCRNKHQWIVQERDPTSTRWRSFSYHRERSSLIRTIRQIGLDATVLWQLPERYSGYSKAGCASILLEDDLTYPNDIIDAPANNLRVTT